MQDEIKIEPGLVVYSRAGRDADRYYMVSRLIDSNYVEIVDGDRHKLENPKKKKLKHMKLTRDVLEGIGRKLVESKQVFDSEIRSALRAFNENK